MVSCPVCGAEVGDHDACPQCHLAVSLFGSVREAAREAADSDPTYLKTIGELLATVDGPAPARPGRGVPGPRLAPREPPVPAAPPVRPPPARPPVEVAPLSELPEAPPENEVPRELKRRITEYFEIGRRLGLDFTDFSQRSQSAALVDDIDSLEVLQREMFVHLSSTIAEEYEACLARRNELANLLSTASADVELTAVRRAIGAGDLSGAQRRLAHVREVLVRIEEQWQVGQILIAEGDLLAETIRELGGDPTPAIGPLEEGRKLFAAGRRAAAEQMCARSAMALWSLLEPRLIADLKRLRDRMTEERAAGLDIEPALAELRGLSTELRGRNFAGTILAYRRLRSTVERTAPTTVEGPTGPASAAEIRTTPSA
ncbi:MAG TPA: hypothetical protein VMG14_04785 [Thermoplasmata archaeon]|jgi:hypothetical protein|nr:hypothetical protein [Thermoplasmata archaeon]